MPLIANKPNSRIVAGGMLREGTPVEDYREEYGLYVKREDKACFAPGPPFSKARGVYRWVERQSSELVGVLDTSHSQAGHAVARACQILGKRCINYYPEFKGNPGPKPSQLAAEALGAELVGLPAGRSAILYHQARKLVTARGGTMIPNALKLDESVDETAREVPNQKFDFVLIPISSGTIAAGVIKGFSRLGIYPTYLIHLGYSRSHAEVEKYLHDKSGFPQARLMLIDEKYQYKDEARDGETPPWPCNPWYDLKAFRWFRQSNTQGSVLFWNIG